MTDPPRRVHFFDGRMITAEDLSAEQAYRRGDAPPAQSPPRVRRCQRPGSSPKPTRDIQVSPGVAINGLGRELILTEPQRVPLGWRRADPGVRDLVLVWGEDFDGQVPGPDGQAVAAWVVERPRVQVARPTNLRKGAW